MRLAGLVASAGINIGLVSIFLALYSVFRNRPANANVYFPRHTLRERDVFRGNDAFTLSCLVPSVGWIQRALQPSEDDIIAAAGLDSAILLRAIIFSMRFFGICTVIGLGVLAPLNYTDTQITHDSQFGLLYDSLDLFTISNIRNGSGRLWAHLVAVYVISISAYFLLYLEYEHVSAKRLKALSIARPAPDQFTVLVRYIPRQKGNPESFSDLLEEFFNRYHPYTYYIHHMIYDDWKIQNMKDRLEKLVRKIEKLKQTPPEQRRRRCFGLWQSRTDLLASKLREAEELYVEIRDSQHRLRNQEEPLPSAFVSFKSRWGAALCAQSQQSENPLAWSSEWAPEPRDVFWPNLAMPFLLTKLYSLGVSVLVFVIIVTYAVPVSLVQTVAQLENLRKWFPAISVLTKIPGVKAVITGYLPSLLLSLLLYTIPFLMLFLSKVQGLVSYSSQEKEAVRKMFWFLVGNVFFVTVLSGSLLDQINVIISKPKDIPNQLAVAVPRQATFFATYILTTGWTGFSMEIVQFGMLVLNFFMVNVLGKNRLELKDVYSAPYYRFIPNVSLFILVGMMYAVLAPLLLPFLLIFFVFGYVVYRNQVLFVYEPAYESSGEFWPEVHGHVVFSLALMQIMFIGVFGVKGKPTASFLMLPLPFITLFFNNYCNHRFLPIFRNLSMETAMKKDVYDEQTGCREALLESLQTAYVHPSLQPVSVNLDASDTNPGLLLPEP